MCIAAIGAIAGLVGSVVGAFGQMQQAKAIQQQANYEAAVKRNMANIEIKRGQVAEENHRIQVSQLKGKQEAAMAANGIDIASGSALDVLGDTAQMGELDALTIRNNAQQRAAGNMAEAELSIMRGKAAKTAGKIGAFSTILGGIGQFASSWNSGASVPSYG